MEITFLIATFTSLRANWRQKCDPLLPGVGCMLYGSLKWMQRQILTKLLTIVPVQTICWPLAVSTARASTRQKEIRSANIRNTVMIAVFRGIILFTRCKPNVSIHDTMQSSALASLIQYCYILLTSTMILFHRALVLHRGA